MGMLPLLFCGPAKLTINNGARKSLPAKSTGLITFSRSLKMNSIKENQTKEILKVLTSSLLVINPMVSNALPETKPEVTIVDDSGALTKSSISFLEKIAKKFSKQTEQSYMSFLCELFPTEKMLVNLQKIFFPNGNLKKTKS